MYFICLFLQDQLVLNVEALRAENDQVRLRATSLHHRYQHLIVVYFFLISLKSLLLNIILSIITENTLVTTIKCILDRAYKAVFILLKKIGTGGTRRIIWVGYFWFVFPFPLPS